MGGSWGSWNGEKWVGEIEGEDMRKRQQPPYPFWRHHIQQYNKKMGKHPNTNWILKTKICYVMRGHKGCRRVEGFSIYFEGIQGFGKCNRTDIFTRCHYWACTEKKGERGLQIFHTRYNYSASPVRSSPVTTPLPQYTRPCPSTSIYYKTDNSKMNGQSV